MTHAIIMHNWSEPARYTHSIRFLENGFSYCFNLFWYLFSFFLSFSFNFLSFYCFSWNMRICAIWYVFEKMNYIGMLLPVCVLLNWKKKKTFFKILSFFFTKRCAAFNLAVAAIEAACIALRLIASHQNKKKKKKNKRDNHYLLIFFANHVLLFLVLVLLHYMYPNSNCGCVASCWIGICIAWKLFENACVATCVALWFVLKYEI